jgi:hypothetical protein
MLKSEIATYFFRPNTQNVSRVFECGLPATDTFKISHKEDADVKRQGYQVTTIPGYMS